MSYPPDYVTHYMRLIVKTGQTECVKFDVLNGAVNNEGVIARVLALERVNQWNRNGGGAYVYWLEYTKS